MGKVEYYLKRIIILKIKLKVPIFLNIGSKLLNRILKYAKKLYDFLQIHKVLKSKFY